MSREKMMDCERNRLKKILDFRLPTAFKWVGIFLLVSAFVLFFVRKQFPEQAELIRSIGRTLFIIGLLSISLVRDKEEDEMTIALRAQSYVIAFIVGVIYAIVMPYVEFGVSNMIADETQAFKELGDFQLLSFMLLIQLSFYHTLKRYR